MPHKSKEMSREYHRAYYRKRRAKIVEYMGGKCALCGSTDGLEVDHVDRSKKSFSVGDRLTLESLIEELEKCQLLCGECHKKKTASENEGFTHGTMYGWMKKKCRCELCLKARRAWYDERNAKRRKRESGGTVDALD